MWENTYTHDQTSILLHGNLIIGSLSARGGQRSHVGSRTPPKNQVEARTKLHAGIQAQKRNKEMYMDESEWNMQLKRILVLDIDEKIQTRRLVESRLGALTVLIGQRDSPLHLAATIKPGERVARLLFFFRETYSVLR
jgi:hypothetical protein